jgi:hypothetical protein
MRYNPPSPESTEIRKLLIQKWHIDERPAMFGDLEVEFTDQNQVIRTYYYRLAPNAVTSYSYQVTEDGQLKATPKIDLKLVKITKDELVLSWDGTVAHYKRGWYWWEIALAIVGVLLLIAIIAIVKERTD